MRLEQLEYFIETVNCKSINKAAKNLYISQPTLSLAIAKMEEEIGAKLLRRTAKGVEATNIGFKIYKDAIKLMQQTDSYLQNWQNDISLSRRLNGDVKLLCMPSAATLISNFVIQELSECSPQIHLHVYEDRIKEDLLSLNDSTIRLVISSYEVDQQEEFYKTVPVDWCIEPLFEDRLSVLISPKNPLSKKSSLSTTDCEKLTLAFYCYQDIEYMPIYVHFFKHCTHIRLNSREAIMQAIAENIAVAIFPQKITRHDFYQKNNLITSVLFDESIQLTNVVHYIAYKNDITAAERKVVDVIHYCAETYYA